MNRKQQLDYYGVNEQQLEAIDITKNISVSAGAGSGKTRILSTRFVRLLKEDADIEVDNIVAITFTKKAALEMKKRIREKIDEEIERSILEEEISIWNNRKDMLQRANISTIHSFCGEIIKENAAMIGVDPGFEIIDSIDKELILSDVYNQAITEIFNNPLYKAPLDILISMYGISYVTDKEKMGKDLLTVITKFYENLVDINDVKEKYNDASVESILIHIIKKIDEEYQSLKKDKDLLDYSDLEKMTMDLLKDKDIREHYQKRFKRFLIDEFQDTNHLQKNIIYKLVCDDDNNIKDKSVFIVGDHKQAIYGFRGTDYKVFEEVTGRIGQDRRRTLDTCYRSEPEIIDTVNKIFKEIISNYEELRPNPDKKNQDIPRVELVVYTNPASSSSLSAVKEHIKNNGKIEDIEESLNKLRDDDLVDSKTNLEPLAIANRIENLVTNKGLEYKDIAVLIRSRTGLKETEKELLNNNIPYCIIGGTGFFQQQEIVDILNVFKYLTNETNLTALIGILRSPLFGLSDDLLISLKNIYYNEKMDSYINSLRELEKEKITDKDRPLIKRACDILEDLFYLSDKLSATELIEEIINKCNIHDRALIQKDGIQKFRNIEKLLRISKEFDSKQLFDKNQFIDYLELVKNISEDEANANLDSEDSNAVKIMTIHASKGLEFKAVIIPQMSKDATAITTRYFPKIAFCREEGLVISSYIDDNGKIKANENHKELKKSQIEQELEEHQRLLYVAMTRAEEYIVMIGEAKESKKNNSGSFKSFMEQIEYVLEERHIQPHFLQVNDFNQETLEIENSTSYRQSFYDPDMITLDESQSKKLKNTIGFKYEDTPSIYGSVSRYMTYTKCPRLYYYKHIIGIDEEDLVDNATSEDETAASTTLSDNIPATLRGTIVHEIIEELGEYDDINSKDIESYIKECLDKVLGEGNYSQETYDNIHRYIENYIKIEGEVKKEMQGDLIYKSPEAEYLFSPFDDNSLYLVGAIDLLEIYEHKGELNLIITDYKTNVIFNENRKDELVELYKPQLMIYAEAARNILRLKEDMIDINISMYLYLLDSGEAAKIDYEPESVRQELSNMKEAFMKIAMATNVEDYKSNGKENCSWCSYNRMCWNKI